jgi:hypothetical protein
MSSEDESELDECVSSGGELRERRVDVLGSLES